MFRVLFFVEDKHLAQVLHSVTGVALNLETQPLTNAKVTKEKPATTKKKVVAKDSGNVTEQLVTAVRGLPDVTITSKQLVKLVTDAGCSPDSYSHFTANLVKLGVLESRSRGVYLIKRETT